jgi:probable DNA repair protein
VLTVSPDLLAAAAAGRTVLAPNTELAAALFDAIERIHRDAGDRIWPTPRVRDWSSWLREQHQLRQLADSNSPRVLNEVEERELWRLVIDGAQVGADFLDPGGAARAAQRARRTLREYAIPLSALNDERSEEAAAFLEWNQAFEQRCRALGCISADTLQGVQGPPLHPVSWIASAQWRPAARRWLERFGEPLRARDCATEAVAVVGAPSPASELAAMAEWARAGLADEAFRAWICVPDLSRRRAEVLDAFDAALAPQRFGLPGAGTTPPPYAVAGGTPLADYAPVRAALELLAASQDLVPFARFSVLLRAPELQASEADSSAAARLDVLLRRRAASEADLAAWLDLAERVARAEKMPPPASVQRLRAAQQRLLELRGVHPFSGWVAVWVAALEAGPWAFRGRWSSIEFQAAERFRELLATLATGDEVFGTQSRDSAQRILRRAARDTSFQVQTGVPAIWISGQLLDPWLNYDGIWVAGCDDERWPSPVVPVALLPIRLQRQFGVISASPALQLASAIELQSHWQKRADKCVFSYADMAQGNSSSPSPLLPKSASRVPMLASVPQPHWRALFATAPILQSSWDELAPPHAPDERTHGVATLRAQSRCAFRGFAETRLDVQRLEHPVPGFSDRERGELVHHALEHIWSTLRDSNALQALLPQMQAQLLDEAAARALTIVCKRRDPGRLWQQRERVRLKNLIGNWLTLERARAPFSIEALEQSNQIAHFAGLDFKVRIDRVDRLMDGARILIDYKTGAASADWRGERPDNPQLPIYALLRPEALVAVAYAKVNAAEPGFVAESERRDILPRTRATKLEGMPAFADLVEVWSRRLTRIAGDFAAGRAEVAPTLKACKSCDLHGLCRVPAALEEADELHE